MAAPVDAVDVARQRLRLIAGDKFATSATIAVDLRGKDGFGYGEDCDEGGECGGS